MSVPRRKLAHPEAGIPTLVPVPPPAASTLSREPSCLRDDYDPEQLIALLRHFRGDPTEDPEQRWAEFLEFARAIDEDRPPSMGQYGPILRDDQ